MRDDGAETARDSWNLRASLILSVVALVLVAPVAAHLLAAVVPGVGSYVVRGASMEPTIPAGALVYVAATGDYGVGEVVTYSREGRTVTHRIVDEVDGGYLTKGDANDAPDTDVVAHEAIIGEVVWWVPGYGLLLGTVAANRYLILTVIGLLLVALATSILRTALDVPGGS